MNHADDAITAVQDLEVDIVVIKGQVEHLLSGKSDTKKWLSMNEDRMSRFDVARKDHTASQQKNQYIVATTPHNVA